MATPHWVPEDDAVAFLARHEPFKRLERERLVELCEGTALEEPYEGQVHIRRGRRIDELMLVEGDYLVGFEKPGCPKDDALIEAHRHLRLLASFKGVNLVGEIEVFTDDDKAVVTGVFPRHGARYVAIPGARVRKLAKKDGKFCFALATLACSRLGNRIHYIDRLASGSLVVEICASLYTMLDTGKLPSKAVRGDEGYRRFKLEVDELVDAVGASGRTVKRAMTALVKSEQNVANRVKPPGTYEVDMAKLALYAGIRAG